MKRLIFKIIAGILIVVGAAGAYFYLQFRPAGNVQFGLTYSTEAAAGLGFDPKTEFLDILNDLKPQKLRLIAYWEKIEPAPGTYDFQQMDELLTETDKRNVDVVLVLGHKEPRWPECHQPDWYNSLDQSHQDQAVLDMIQVATTHFKKFHSVKVWQVENEPFFGFGPECSQISQDLLKQEIQTVRSIDSRPIMLTDSGEKGDWIHTARTGADILGITMYRIVVDKNFGYEKYPIPPLYYRINAGLMQKLTKQTPIVGIELQAEPWMTAGFEQVDLNQQLAIMNPKVFAQNIAYAKSVGFSENYLWGVEWWYWLAKNKNDWGMWNAAKQAIGGNNL